MAGYRIEMAPGDEIIVSGDARIFYRHKSGKRADMCVVPTDPETAVLHVKRSRSPAESAPDPALNKPLSKIESVE